MSGYPAETESNAKGSKRNLIRKPFTSSTVVEGRRQGAGTMISGRN